MSFEIEVNSGSSVRLPTAGKYCDRDIIVTATGGGGGDTEAAYNEGFADGKQAEYDLFWDVCQNYGNKTFYYNGFFGYTFSAENFYPKYDMHPTADATQMFYSWKEVYLPGDDIDLAERLEQCGVVLDTSNVTNAKYLFGNSTKFTRLPAVDLRNATKADWVFWGCERLVTIDKITVSETTGIEKDWFGGCVKLANVTFDGTIGKSISFYQCPNLTTESVQSVVDHLKDLTGQTALTLTFHATVGGKLTDAQKATVTAKNWTLVY